MRLAVVIHVVGQILRVLGVLFLAPVAIIVVYGGRDMLGVALWSSGASDPLRTALFQTLSVLTTTGYASVDFDLWNGQAKVVLLVLMFIGGCAGSAAGRPKVLRHLLIGRYTLQERRRTLHPRGVLPVRLGRLEVVAVLALLRWEVWRLAHWRER